MSYAHPPLVYQTSPDADRSYDEPYRFHRPTVRAPFPFTERQFARLLILRSRTLETLDASPTSD